MSAPILSARLTFSQIGLFVAIIVYLAVRGFFVIINIGLLWTTVGGFLAIAIPFFSTVFLGFVSCVIAYGYSYLGLWLMDKNQHVLGMITIFLSVIILPGILGAYSYLAFPPV